MRSLILAHWCLLLAPANSFLQHRRLPRRIECRSKAEIGSAPDGDGDDRDYVNPMRERPRPAGGDVAYTSENILAQLRTYNRIRDVGGPACVSDIYVKDPNPGAAPGGGDRVYWFVGKAARCSGVTPGAAVARLRNLIEEHATRVRPVELGRHFGGLEVYVAPGDTEARAAGNDPSVRLVRVERDGRPDSGGVDLVEVGLNLEIVTNRGVGLSVVRTEDGIVPPHLLR